MKRKLFLVAIILTSLIGRAQWTDIKNNLRYRGIDATAIFTLPQREDTLFTSEDRALLRNGSLFFNSTDSSIYLMFNDHIRVYASGGGGGSADGNNYPSSISFSGGIFTMNRTGLSELTVTINTTEVPEGTNLYYTSSRFNTAFGTKSTTDLTEGSNLYFTNARARGALSEGFGIDFNSTTGVITVDTAALNATIASVSWENKSGFDSLIWYKSVSEIRVKAIKMTINGSDPTKTITDSTISLDFTVASSGTNSNLGSGFRWLDAGSQGIKTAFAGFGVSIDSSSNTNGITFKADSSSLATKYHSDNYFASRSISSALPKNLQFAVFDSLRNQYVFADHNKLTPNFTPLLIPELIAWYDFTNSGSLTLVSGRISQANDLSGNGNHLVQGTANSRPDWLAEAGGYAIFDTIRPSYLSRTLTTPDTTNYTLYVLVKKDSNTSWISSAEVLTTRQSPIAGILENNTFGGNYRGSDGVTGVASTTQFARNQYHLVRVKITANGYNNVHINDEPIARYAYDAPGTGTLPIMNFIRMGINSATASNFKVKEAWVVSGVVSDQTDKDMWDYVQRKHGLYSRPYVLAIGDSHIYGIQSGTNQGYPFYLNLAARTGLPVYNNGINGTQAYDPDAPTTATNLNNIKETWLKQGHPTNGWVLFEYGTNESLTDIQNPAWKESYKTSIRAFIDAGYSKDKIILMTAPYSTYANYATQSTNSSILVRQIAAEMGVKVADVNADMIAAGLDVNYVLGGGDHIHGNDSIHDVMATSVYAQMVTTSGSSSVSGRSGWYGKFSSTSAVGIGNLQDTLVGTYLFRKEFYMNMPGSFTQSWFKAIQDETAHTTSITIKSPYTTDGATILFDSTTKQFRFVALGSNSDIYFSSFRNVQMNNTGTFTVTNSIVTAGILSSAQITSNATTGGYLFGGKASAANNFAGAYLDNDLNERFEFRVAGSTYGSYPVRTAHIFSSLRDGMNIYLYGASPTLKTYVGGLTSTELMSTMGVGYTMFKAGLYLNWGTTSGTSGYGIWDDGGVLKTKNSGGSWAALVSVGTANTFTANQTFNGPGASITASGGTSGAVVSGTSFGLEAASTNTPILGSNSATSSGSVTGVILQRSGVFTAAAGDALDVRFDGRTSTGASKDYAYIRATLTTVTNGAEVGAFSIRLANAGTVATTTTFNGNGSISMFNGTAPAASVTDGILLYPEDVASSSELKVRDEAGNITTLSPHNFTGIPGGRSEEMAWAYYSEKDGKYINVDMVKLVRMVEKLTGEKLVYVGDTKAKPNSSNK